LSLCFLFPALLPSNVTDAFLDRWIWFLWPNYSLYSCPFSCYVSLQCSCWCFILEIYGYYEWSIAETKAVHNTKLPNTEVQCLVLFNHASEIYCILQAMKLVVSIE